MKILLVSWISPLPTSVGSSQRTHLLYRALSELGTVDLALLRDPSDLSSDVLNRLRDEFNLKVCTPIPRPGNLPPWKHLPLPLKWRSRIGHNIEGGRRQLRRLASLSRQVRSVIDFNQYDLIVGRYFRSVAVLGLHEDRPAPLLVDVDDWEPDRYRTQIASSRHILERAILRRHLGILNQRLPDIAGKTDALWIADPANRAIPALEDATYLPNIPFDVPNDQAQACTLPEDTDTLMTIGSYIYPPNISAVHWFLQHVWPRILARHGSAKFKIYGSHLDSATRDAWNRHPNVIAVGFVEHVKDAYRDASAAICAVRSGAGTNIKVLEAMRYQRPCIATLTGARGFAGLVDAGAVFATDDPETMAEHAVHLLTNPDEARQRGKAGAQFVDKHLSWNAFREAVHQGVRQALHAAQP